MNYSHFKYLSQHFDLGIQIHIPQRVYGGLLHKMWRLDTEKGSFAIKQLSINIDLKNKQIIKNYEWSERIASHFIALGIPAICAIVKSDKYLFIVEETGIWFTHGLMQRH